jgi:hypothetical protein
MDTANFRLVKADRLDTSAGRLDDVVVLSADKTPLGKLEGVVVDPAELRVHYFVVGRRGWWSSRHYLVPMRTARLAADAHALEVDVPGADLLMCERVDVAKLPEFTPDDLHSGWAHPHAA